MNSANLRLNVQIEMLKWLLSNELKTVAKRNLITERKFSEMLERAMRTYTNRLLMRPRSSPNSSSSRKR